MQPDDQPNQPDRAQTDSQPDDQANQSSETPRQPTPGEREGDRNIDQGGPIPTGEAAVRAGETKDNRNLLQKAEDKVRSVLDDTQP